MAGTGKSTIAFTICRLFDTAAPRKVLGASFFCSRQTEKLRQLGQIVPNVVYQLSQHSRSFAAALQHVKYDAGLSSYDQMDELLVKPWRDSAEDRQDLLPTLLVVDALDEIEGDGGQTFLQRLVMETNKAQNSIPGLKILVTSRPHPSIVNMARHFPVDAVYRLEDITKADARQDVQRFLSQQLPALDESQLAVLVTRSDGLFIYAATLCRLVVQPGRRLSSKQLVKRVAEIIRAEDGIPIHGDDDMLIDSLYKQVVSESIQASPPEYRDVCLAIIHAVVTAFQPLSVAELSRLVAPSDDDPDAVRIVVESLHSVLQVSKDHVYTYHKSFADFMLSTVRSGPLTCEGGGSHSTLTRGCFQVLTDALHFNMCELPSSFVMDSEAGIPARLEQYIFPITALEYACHCWVRHLVGAGDQQPLDAAELTNFVDGRVLFWIEVMNLLDAKSECMSSIMELSRWCKLKVRDHFQKIKLILMFA